MASDFYAFPFGTTYSAYMERPCLSRLIGRLVWGGDDSAYYESMRSIGEVAPASALRRAAWRSSSSRRTRPASRFPRSAPPLLLETELLRRSSSALAEAARLLKPGGRLVALLLPSMAKTVCASACWSRPGSTGFGRQIATQL